MAKLTLNPAFQKLRGKVGDWVLRHWRGKSVAQRSPKRSRRRLTPPQKLQVELFTVAAKAGPDFLATHRAACRRLALAWGKSDISVAVQACYFHCSVEDLPLKVRKSSVARP